MKRIRLLISLLSLCAITLPSLGQSVRSNSFDIPYVDTPSSNPLKEPAPEFKYREASGMARIIPVFAPGFPTKYQAAVSYACQLMEESLPTCYPMKAKSELTDCTMNVASIPLKPKCRLTLAKFTLLCRTRLFK